jgi:hypothetical protein
LPGNWCTGSGLWRTLRRFLAVTGEQERKENGIGEKYTGQYPGPERPFAFTGRTRNRRQRGPRLLLPGVL